MIISQVILLFIILKIYVIRGNIRDFPITNYTSTNSDMENLLLKFMCDLIKNSLTKLQYHDLMVIGKNDDYLRTTEVIIRDSSSPYFINSLKQSCTSAITNKEFGESTVVLIFIDDLTDCELNTIFAEMPKSYNSKLLFISLKINATLESITAVTSLAAKHYVRNISFAKFDGEWIKIYRKQWRADHCLLKWLIVNTWNQRDGFKKNHIGIIGSHTKRINYMGCEITVSAYNTEPTIMLTLNENKNLWEITGGLEGNYVTTIAKKLNATLTIKPPSIAEKYYKSSTNGKLLGIVGDVVNHDATIGIGQIKPSFVRNQIVDLTTSHNHECMVWIVPLKYKCNCDLIFGEFSQITWIIVFISLSLCCLVTFGYRKLYEGRQATLQVLDLVAIFLGQSISTTRVSDFNILQKYYLIIYSNYFWIIAIAYSTSLASILTTTIPIPLFVDEETIIEAGLRTGGSETSRRLLQQQIYPNTRRSKLIENYVTVNVDEAIEWLTDRKDFSYLRHLSTAKYKMWKHLKEGKPMAFYPLSLKCVLSFHSVFVIDKGSSITEEVNEIILRLREAGMNEHWNQIDDRSEREVDSLPRKLRERYHTLSEFRSIFNLHIAGLFLAILVFLAELTIFKLRSN